jgi:hypothetical protein
VFVNSNKSGGGGCFSNYSLLNHKVLYFYHFLTQNPSIHEFVNAYLAENVKHETGGGKNRVTPITPKKRGKK